MGFSDSDLTESKIELERVRERLRYVEEQFLKQERELEQANFNLGRKDAELKQVTDGRNELNSDLRITKSELRHAEEALSLSSQRVTKKRNAAKFLAFLASLIFLVTSVLVNIGTSMLTSTPPNSLGWIMIAIAAMLYIIAAFMTTLLALEGGN